MHNGISGNLSLLLFSRLCSSADAEARRERPVRFGTPQIYARRHVQVLRIQVALAM
jgi:hypothetical protein